MGRRYDDGWVGVWWEDGIEGGIFERYGRGEGGGEDEEECG